MKHLSGTLFGILTVLCWSACNVAAKYAVDTSMPPDAVAFLRYTMPGVLSLPLLVAITNQGNNAAIPVRRLVALILLGGPVFGLAAISGYVYAPLSHGVLFAPVAVFINSSLLGYLFLREGFSTTHLAGAAVMLLGLAALVGFDVSLLGKTWGRGSALFILAGCVWGGYTVLLRLWRIPVVHGTLAVTSGSALLAVPALGFTAHPALLAASPSALALQIVMQGFIGGCLSVVAFIGAARRLPLQVTALLPVFTPIAALSMVWVIFGITPSQKEALGTLLIATGFLISMGLSKAKVRTNPRVSTRHGRLAPFSDTQIIAPTTGDRLR